MIFSKNDLSLVYRPKLIGLRLATPLVSSSPEVKEDRL